MLGQIQRNKKLLNNMEMKMNKVVTELKDKQLQFDQKIKEAEEIDKKLKIVSAADIIKSKTLTTKKSSLMTFSLQEKIILLQ